MKIHNITEGYSYISDSNPQPEQKVVDKFARVADSQRSYYIMKWAEEKGMDTDDAMHKAGYVKDGYLGAGAYNWRYVGMGESVEEANNPDAGEYTYTLELNGESQGYTTHTLTITSPEGESKVVADDFTYFEVEGDELQAELHSWFNMGHGVGDESVQEADDEVDTGPTWKDDLEDALDGYPEWAHEYIKDGVCPECGGNGYMDGDYENEDGEENDECNGMYNYDCDEGEIRDNTWADELKSKEPEAPKQPAPSKEQIMKILPRLHDDYVKTGRYNAFELGGILKQMYPELNKREAGSYVADFLSTFKEDISEPTDSEDKFEKAMAAYDAQGEEGLAKALGMSIEEFDQELNQYGMEHGLHADDDRDTIIQGMVEQMADDADQMSDMRRLSGIEEDMDEVAGAKDCWDGYKKDGTQAGTGKNKGKRVNKCVKEENLDESSDEVMVAKMLAKALGDENRWTEMSAPELYAELESENSYMADMIKYLAKMLYDVKLQERAYKDVGVADTVKDQRGKEFNFDKSSKKFKSQDGEEADITTKLGKDLMRQRKNHMKRTSPSYPNKHSK
jgi:hypothetical protein